MAIEARAILLKNLETKLSDQLTATNLVIVMQTVADTVTDFQIEQLVRGTNEYDDLYDAYITAIKIQGRSDSTIWRYEYVLTRMFKAVNLNSRQITVYHLRKYLQEEKDRGISDVTLDGYRQIYCAYFNWLQREGLIVSNPTANLGAIKHPKRLKKAYSDVDIEKLRMKVKNARDRAILYTLISTGCRIAEICGMNIRDMDLVKLECTVIGKGNKERIVYIDDVTAMAIKTYLDTRTDDEEALFISYNGSRLQPGGVRYMLRKLAKRAGVKEVHPHKFRRTLATNLNKHGMPMQEIAAILGHAKLDTTMKYVVQDKDIIKGSYHRYY